MSFEEPTQRLRVVRPEPAPHSDTQTTAAQTTAAQTTAALPRPLSLADSTPPSQPDDRPDDRPADRTDELSLDEIFAAPDRRTAGPDRRAPQPAGTDEAPTWTAMPVIPVRSEPIAAAPDTAGQTERTGQTDQKRTGPSTGERLFRDATAALDGAVRRSQEWLSRDDNGLMLMTAVVAIILILVVAAVGS